jgi:hypothetical protein
MHLQGDHHRGDGGNVCDHLRGSSCDGPRRPNSWHLNTYTRPYQWLHLTFTLLLFLCVMASSPSPCYAFNNSVPNLYRTTGMVQTFPASLNQPHGLVADLQRNIYIADTASHVIRFASTRGQYADQVILLAGTVGTSGTRDGSATVALFNQPKGLAVMNITSSTSYVYVADTNNHRIRLINITFNTTIPYGRPISVNVITLGGSVSGYQGGPLSASRFFYPWSLTIARGGLVIADEANHLIRHVPLIPSNLTLQQGAIVTILAGQPSVSGSVDGTASVSLCSYPTGVTVCPDGTIWWLEWHTLRRLNLANITATIAGSQTPGYRDGNGTNVAFNSPSDAVCDSRGQLYISDSTNQRIRLLNSSDPSFTIRTFIGTGISGHDDGRPLTATLSNPTSMAVYPSPSLSTYLYIADTDNNAIRAVSSVCWSSCRNNGNCTRTGVCVCQQGFQGTDCSAGICTTKNCANSRMS